MPDLQLDIEDLIRHCSVYDADQALSDNQISNAAMRAFDEKMLANDRTAQRTGVRRLRRKNQGRAGSRRRRSLKAGRTPLFDYLRHA